MCSAIVLPYVSVQFHLPTDYVQLLREQRHIYKTTKTMMDGLCQRSAEKYWVKAAMAKRLLEELP